MVAVDTNVLVRLLLGDDEAQASAARAVQRTQGPLFLSHVVLAETAWVLASAYGFRRERLGTLMEMLLDADGFVVQDAAIVVDALASFTASKADFSDCLILSIAKSAGAAPLATFDDKLGKVPGARRIGAKRRRP
jgi:predicted nucleic-acid-binding protein